MRLRTVVGTLSPSTVVIYGRVTQELIAYFDPDHDGTVVFAEVEAALSSLDLGLSQGQLQQLILQLGYREHDNVDPMNVLRLLLGAVAPATAKHRHTSSPAQVALMLQVHVSTHIYVFMHLPLTQSTSIGHT